jgi:L-amino acid N-acyltransferase YncA
MNTTMIDVTRVSNQSEIIGIVQKLYGHFRDCLSKEYTYLITDIAQANARSLKAHQKRGFQVINELMYGGIKWDIVLWDWNTED